ncbi:hypothetical protein L1987_05311 [Smallanthus sonchifolius]|uniref:Uncharacterized protein n=1 Tax=Smallanthus sonchifolius TaxID=185202 RepID=A0ACB9JV08_9ASTR|nr:hypothetical protein L1987_05311 [Smallanthus sonchifolius]
MWVFANHTHSQLGVSNIVQNKKKIHLWDNYRDNLAKWELFGVKARFHVEDKRLMSLSLSDLGSTFILVVLTPEPLSAKDLAAPSNDRAKVRVAYQGSPGAYSETAALKAYPICKTVPCDQIESVCKAVELWLVDKGVLPIENSVGGSIHRNYDLLLHHRLHIVGEVELVVNHRLLGLPGVRKEELTHVLSHPQALEQCETTLNKLGIVRVSTQDSAGAAQIVALEGIRETGAVASLLAAEIYRLDVLA